MKFLSTASPFTKTTACRFSLMLVVALAFVTAGCGSRPSVEAEHEEEAESRTEFTGRIENFFEYDPLKAGEQSQFLIHLTDLTDGTPVEKADVVLSVSRRGGGGASQIKARVGKVTGIYVADVTIPQPGDYNIEFHVRNPKIDERMALTDFKVE